MKFATNCDKSAFFNNLLTNTRMVTILSKHLKGHSGPRVSEIFPSEPHISDVFPSEGRSGSRLSHIFPSELLGLRDPPKKFQNKQIPPKKIPKTNFKKEKFQKTNFEEDFLF